ncbi:hypothetical protein C8R48DRAFT_595481, partial [Suillus tomentosus]
IVQYTSVETNEHNMCPDLCLAFTGLYATLEICSLKVAAQKITIIPLSPQLQALYCDPDSAHNIQYLHEQTQQILIQSRATQFILVIDDITV